MKLDPNLSKIADYNMRRIKNGQLGRPIFQAKDYLEHIYCHDTDAMNKELDNFVAYMKKMIKPGQQAQCN